jgi:hypothetical protein
VKFSSYFRQLQKFLMRASELESVVAKGAYCRLVHQAE